MLQGLICHEQTGALDAFMTTFHKGSRLTFQHGYPKLDWKQLTANDSALLRHCVYICPMVTQDTELLWHASCIPCADLESDTTVLVAP